MRRITLRTTCRLLLALAPLVSGCGDDARRDDANQTDTRNIHVFAAASFADVVRDLAASFEVLHPQTRVLTSLAASSVLARQIASGAPANVFITADQSWIEYLRNTSDVLSYKTLGITNRIVLFTDGRDATAATVAELDPGMRIAVGNPDHVPIGQYARTLLECTGDWENISPRVVPTADARSALQLLKGRAVGAALGYASDRTFLGGDVTIVALPDSCQPAIEYGVAVLNSGRAETDARRFADFVADEKQQPTWERFGFTITTEDGVRSPETGLTE